MNTALGRCAPEKKTAVKSSSSGELRRKRRISIASSGLLTALILAAVLGIVGALWVAHLHGKLHKLSTSEIPQDTTVLPRPGDQDVLQMNRMAPASSTTPEFVGLSAMPGVGMGILQLALNLPGGEPQDILQSTPIPSMTPFLDKKTSAVMPGLEYSPISLTVFPLQGSSAGREILGAQSGQNVRGDMVPGGTGTTANFPSASAPGPTGIVTPPSGFDTTVSATISDRGFDLTISAKNVSGDSQAVVLSWTPKLLLPGGSLDKLRMTPPDTVDPLPSEKSAVKEIELRPQNLPRTWSGLKYSYLSTGSELQLHDLQDSYILRIIALTPSIRSVHAELAPGGKSLALTISTEGPNGKRTVVEPGETLQWRLRIQPTSTNTYKPTIN